MKAADDIREQLKGIMQKLFKPLVSPTYTNPNQYFDSIKRALLAGYFMQVFIIISLNNNVIINFEGCTLTEEWMLYDDEGLTGGSYSSLNITGP